MNRAIGISFGVGLSAAAFLAACATTQITANWKDKSYGTHPEKIMVIGIAKKPENRRFIEDEFVRRIKARGTVAFSAYTVLPDEKQSDNAVIAEKMKESGADAVLIARLADKRTVYNYVPGADYPPFYCSWGDYYTYSCREMYSPGYTEEDQYAVMETNLYDAGKSNLVWSASSNTEVLYSDQNFIKSYIETMVKTMVEQKLLK